MSNSLEAISTSTIWSIANHTRAMSDLQEQAASGREINRVSDDPTAAGRILALKAESRSKERYLNSINEALSVLDLSSSVLQAISEEITHARTSLMSVMSGVINNSTRQTLAADLDNALEQIVALANTQRLGSSLFSGADTNVLPYTVERNENGEITRVIYQGSNEERKIDVAPGVEMSWVLSGESLFKSDGERQYSTYGSTGAKIGSGESNVRGDVMLTVGGAPGAYTLSIDGGVTTVTMTGSTPPDDNLPVVNPKTQEVLYVDATGITSTGIEPVRVEGTYDIFNIFINARDLLRNSEDLSQDKIQEMLAATQVSLRKVDEKFVQTFPVIGGRMGTLTSLKESMEDTKVVTDEEIARLQDADITQVAINLAKHEVLYEMSLSVAAKMFSISFLDFIQ